MTSVFVYGRRAMVVVVAVAATASSGVKGVGQAAPEDLLEVNLEPGFVPDPYLVSVAGGGATPVGHVSACEKSWSDEPSVRLGWGGSDRELRILFLREDEVRGDTTTLLVRQPDGEFACSEAYSGEDTAPFVLLTSPDSGDYAIWVGPDEPERPSGCLAISELSIAPGDIRDFPCGRKVGGQPDSPFVLEAGFEPDPHVLTGIRPGGPLWAGGADLGPWCSGFISEVPNARLTWRGDSRELRLFFSWEEGDATLAVRTPEGRWICNDDYGQSSDPGLHVYDPEAGDYDIWVGTDARPDAANGTGCLVVTEIRHVDEDYLPVLCPQSGSENPFEGDTEALEDQRMSSVPAEADKHGAARHIGHHPLRHQVRLVESTDSARKQSGNLQVQESLKEDGLNNE